MVNTYKYFLLDGSFQKAYAIVLLLQMSNFYVDDEEEEEEEDDKDEDEDYKEADDDIKKDPLFDPDEDEYVETPENSDGSGDDYIISKKSTKSRKKGRKRSSDRRLTRSQSHTMRQPRVTRSKASYQESESEDDSDEDFTLHRGQPSRHRTKSS